MVQWYNSRILILSTGVQSLSSSTRKRANKWLPEYNYQVLQILFLFHDLDFLFLLIHVLCHVFSLKQKGKREKRKDIALHTTVLSENKREKINKKAFCNTIFSRTILVIFFSNNNISNIWLYDAWKRHPVVVFSHKLEKTKHLIEAHSMLHIANKDLCST